MWPVYFPEETNNSDDYLTSSPSSETPLYLPARRPSGRFSTSTPLAPIGDDPRGEVTLHATRPPSRFSVRSLTSRLSNVGTVIYHVPHVPLEEEDSHIDYSDLLAPVQLNSLHSTHSGSSLWRSVHSLTRRVGGLFSSSRGAFSPYSFPSPFHGSSESIDFAREPNEAIDLNELFNANATYLLSHHSEPSSLKDSPVRHVKKRVNMGSLYRSEEMKLCQLIMVKDAAYSCVSEIGKHSNVQLIDLNAHLNVFQRNYVRDVRRCEDLERTLRFLERQVVECVPGIDLKPIDVAALDVPSANEINNLENRLSELEKEIRQLNESDANMRKRLNESKEMKHVLEKVESFFSVHLDDEAKVEIRAQIQNMNEPVEMVNMESGATIPLNEVVADAPNVDDENPWFITGVIPCERRAVFERIVWRACRRTAFVRTSDIDIEFEDPITQVPVSKSVFIVFFKGESLRNIVLKVCEGFDARVYPCAEKSSERQHKRIEMEKTIEDLELIIRTSQNHRHMVLSEAAHQLPEWLKVVHLQKAVYHHLNMFTVDTNGFLAAECWVPANELEGVRRALGEGVRKCDMDVVSPILNVLETRQTPPTFNRTNKFTAVFQGIVDSYGVASYREINPAPYTIITFPFLFAVMFGDLGHGLIMLLAGLAFLYYEKQIVKSRIRDEIFNTFFGGRYIIVLMGLFSIYTGMIYNDAFGKAANVFGSSWRNPYNRSEIDSWQRQSALLGKDMLVTLDPAAAYLEQDGPYPFGVDPIWNVADNRLSFLNSMKMKASVVIGIAQMAFGVVLGFFNFRFFRSSVDVWTNFVPQILFLSSIFVYLCCQIVVKWIYFSVHPGMVLGQDYPGSNCAPSLLIGLINMFMLKDRRAGFHAENGTEDVTCYLNQWYPHQSTIEASLLAIALCCVPVMLIGKPLSHWLSHSGTKAGRGKSSDEEAAQLVEGGGGGGATAASPSSVSQAGEVEHAMGDVVVHQAIHTIEFVLGCVSHTASYLRLWALSLAHAQLSEVLWHMVLMAGMNLGGATVLGGLLAYVVFFVFASMSLSILVLMEGLSAFLHALRLHWVEFQSKFYGGLGYAFHPFSLQECLETAQHLSETTEDVD